MAQPIKILVTGANGQLGSELKVLSSSKTNWDWQFRTSAELSITDHDALEEFFKAYRPSVCINCAAYTAVDKAESEKEKAFAVNGTAAGKLAELCSESGTQLIHISTDYIFDGNSTTPYKEDHPVNPVNAYGASKLAGEESIMDNDPNAIIIRTAWVYSSFGNNFVKTMMRLMKERKELSVVDDQTGSPTHAADLAAAIITIIELEHREPGIYHYTNSGITTWYGFAKQIAMLINSPVDLKPIPTSDYPTPAARPAYSVLDCSRIKEVFGIEPPEWKASLKSCIDKLV